VSERFVVRPEGKYWAIWWGPTLICTSWSDEASAQALCDILEALRQEDVLGERPESIFAAMERKEAWARFRDLRQAGRG